MLPSAGPVRFRLAFKSPRTPPRDPRRFPARIRPARWRGPWPSSPYCPGSRHRAPTSRAPGPSGQGRPAARPPSICVLPTVLPADCTGPGAITGGGGALTDQRRAFRRVHRCCSPPGSALQQRVRNPGAVSSGETCQPRHSVPALAVNPAAEAGSTDCHQARLRIRKRSANRAQGPQAARRARSACARARSACACALGLQRRNTGLGRGVASGMVLTSSRLGLLVRRSARSARADSTCNGSAPSGEVPYLARPPDAPTGRGILMAPGDEPARRRSSVQLRLYGSHRTQCFSITLSVGPPCDRGRVRLVAMTVRAVPRSETSPKSGRRRRVLRRQPSILCSADSGTPDRA